VKRAIHLPSLVLVMGILCGCSSAPQQDKSPTPTATQTPAPTNTVVWFPPTTTPTIASTVAILPTPNQRPGMGELVMSDDFSDASLWFTGTGKGTSAAYGKGEFTLAISSAKTSQASLRNGILPGDLYLEITASPSLCRGEDSYGLLVRAASNISHYRFLANCAGMVKAERWKNGERVTLQDWMPSGQVPPGSPLVIRLGVWAAGGEMRFFINDAYQFSVRDPVWQSGQVGVTGQSAGDSPLTVSFSNLKVWTIDASSLKPTPTSLPASATPTVKKTG